MRQSNKRDQNSPPSQSTLITIVATLLGIGVLVLIALVALRLWQRMAQAAPTSTPVIAPTVVVPTVPCAPQTLAVAGTTFQIQNLTLAPDSSLAPPPATAGVAYWLQTTEGNHLFVLSPTPENLSLPTTLTAESPARITWADCSSIAYSLSAPEPNPANLSALAGQLGSGLTIFFQTDESGNGLIVRGEITKTNFP